MSRCVECWAEAERRHGSGDPRPVPDIYAELIARPAWCLRDVSYPGKEKTA